MSEQTWIPDVLGDGFEQTTLPLGSDDEGEVVATLVRLLPAPPSFWDRLRRKQTLFHDVDVLYVHGWSDYFFQKRLARYWAGLGARFFALDLRKYGRSLRAGQTAGYVTDLSTYDEDIAAALGAMGWDAARGHSDRRLVLLGHSTGGLTLSLWAARHPGVATGVILNSPWLTLQLPQTTRALVASVLSWSSQHWPTEPGPQLDGGFYTRAQREVAEPDDEPVNLDWRPEQTMPVYAGWLHAIVQGQNRVQAGLDIDAPVCVMTSARSAVPLRWSEELTQVDSVLVVADIVQAATHLGRTVWLERIDGALHDVFLSQHDAREDAYRRLDLTARRMLTASLPEATSRA
ncbi:alpha/beta hydrolase [Microbacterium gorillae]|uniref:alpha/beta hydrolase n=1 Tax=Microbacterium gorillae TaxID=1231063 RepID=UPI003D97FE81